MRATELDHEALDDAMEMEPIVKARLGQIDEVLGSQRHLVKKEFHFEIAQTGLKRCRGIGHGEFPCANGW
jgi:hypothetical protein